MEYGLLGEHLGHSYSEAIHKRLGGYKYEIIDLPSEEFSSFMGKRQFKGINVTIPYKERVIPYLDYVSPEVQEIGACNIVVNKDGKLYGYNSDAFGLESIIKKSNIQIQGKKTLILGTGGTSKTAHYVLKTMGAASIIHASRTSKGSALAYDSIPNDIEVIVNTTPCGMFPHMDESPINLSRFPSLLGVIDVIYNPLRTRLVQQAEALGIPVISGLYMLVAQAAKAKERFLDVDVNPKQIEEIYESLLKAKRNIVLIGMPSSGKTTIGQVLAKDLGMAFIDTDVEIEKRIHMPIPAYFETHGEKAFRLVESQVVEGVAKLSGMVIATGGGAILNPSNVMHLKFNGVVCFLDRSLEKLMPTKDRPLSSNVEALKKRYQERHGLYLDAADIVIEGDGTVSETAKIIKERLQ